MIARNIKADRIIVLSDNECNGSWYSKPVQALADAYRLKTGNTFGYTLLICKATERSSSTAEKTNIISGWSEKVFEFIKLAEQGEGNLEKVIEQYAY